MRKGWFWRELWSGDNSKVNTMAVFAAFLAGPIVLLAIAAIIFHVFIKGKGLDSPTVQLFLGLLGAATGGLGASMFSRSLGGRFPGVGPPEGWKPPPLKKE